MSKKAIQAVLVAILSWIPAYAGAIEFNIVNNDSENEGLNDQRVVEPIEGNNFTKLGDQRIRVISAALEYIGGLLKSDTVLSVSIQFDDLLCDADTALLGGGAPVDSFVNFDGAPKYQTNYPAALANLHSGQDLAPDSPELELIFNGNIDFNNECLADTNLYYGVDDKEPEGTINFYSIVLHEVLHAIGFMTYMDGQGATLYGYSDPLLDALFDPITGNHLSEVGASNYSVYQHHPIVFFGSETRFRAHALTQGVEPLATALNGEPVLAPHIYVPSAYDPGSSFNHWDISLTPTPLMAPFNTQPVTRLSEFELAALHDIGWPVNLPEQDRDGDGVADRNDGSPDDPTASSWPDEDADRNNLPDDWETEHGIDYQSRNVYADRDSDGLSNINEYTAGTDPVSPDTDGDGLGDWAELLLGYDPLSDLSCPTADCKSRFSADSQPLNFDLDYYIHENVSPDRPALNAMPTFLSRAKDGGLFVSGFSDSSGGYAEQVEGHLVKLNSAGKLDTTFGGNGQISIKDLGASNGNSGSVVPAEDSKGRLYAFSEKGFNGRTLPRGPNPGYYHLVWEYEIHRVDHTGRQDNTFTPIHVETAGIAPFGISLAVDGQDRLVVAYNTTRIMSDVLNVVVERYLPDGQPDSLFADGGTFTFAESESVRISRLKIGPNDDLYLGAYDFGLPHPTGASVLKLSSNGAVDSEYGNGTKQGFLLVDHINDFHILDSGLVTFSSIDDPDDDNHKRLLRVGRYDHLGDLKREYLINSLPLDSFHTHGCARSPEHWVCVAETDKRYISDEFESDSLYAQVFDLEFKALTGAVQQAKVSVPGERSDPEQLGMIAHTDEGVFTVASRLSSPTEADATIGLRQFSTTGEWLRNYGEGGLAKWHFKGASEAITSAKVDEMQHAIVGFVQTQAKVDSWVNRQAGLLHFFPNGERDQSFGVNGFIPIPSDPDGQTSVVDLAFDEQKNLFVLAMTVYPHNDRGSQMHLFKLARTGAPGYSYSEAELRYNFNGHTFFEPKLLSLPNNELLIKFSQSQFDVQGRLQIAPSAHLHHLNEDGSPVTRIWEHGRHEIFYEGLQTYTTPGFFGLTLDKNGTLWFHEVVPPELDNGGTYLQSISLSSETKASGDLRTHFFVDSFTQVEGILPLPDVDRFFVYGSTCLIALKCSHSYFGYYAIVDSNGEVDQDFNEGEPVLLFQGGREDVAGRTAYQIDDEILVTATQDNGWFAHGGTEEHPERLINAGNGFYAVALDTKGQVLGNGPFTSPTQGFEIYGDCQLRHPYSGTCAVLNDHFTDVRILSWKDPGRIFAPQQDSDGDGIPDIFEHQFELDPHQADDASHDLDGDGISNLLEFRRGMNMSFDDVPPELILPADITLNSIGAYTRVDTGQPTAVDARDGILDLQSDAKDIYPPGRHKITWIAEDSNLNKINRTQHVNIIPLVSVLSEIETDADSDVMLRASLNGQAPQYPILVPLDTLDVYPRYYAESHEFHFTHGQENSNVKLAQMLNKDPSVTVISTQMSDVTLAGAGRTLKTTIESYEGAFSSHDLLISQNGVLGSWIEQSGGEVSVNLMFGVAEPLTYTYDWSATDLALLRAASATGSNLKVDPSQLNDGLYRISVAIRNGSYSLHKTDLLRVKAKPALSIDSDSDLDGKDDWNEGSGDSNQNRVPDYLDPDARSFLLPMSYNPGDVVEADAVLNIRLGEVAFGLGLGHPLVTDSQLQKALGEAYALPSEIRPIAFAQKMVEFEISGLGKGGGEGSVAIPTHTALPDDASLFWLTALNGWRTMDQQLEHTIAVASTSMVNGLCPAGQQASYKPGLNLGDRCIKLVLQDGGIADFDTTLDRTIRFIGGVHVKQPAPGAPSGEDNPATPPDNKGGSSSSYKSTPGASGGGGAIDSLTTFFLFLIFIFRTTSPVRLRPSNSQPLGELGTALPQECNSSALS